jgi:hypothetical protein
VPFKTGSSRFLGVVRLVGCLILFPALVGNQSAAAQTVTFHPSRALGTSAPTTSLGLINFEGLAPQGGFYLPNSATAVFQTTDGLTISGNGATGNISDARREPFLHYNFGSGANYQNGMGVLISYSSGFTTFGIDIASYSESPAIPAGHSVVMRVYGRDGVMLAERLVHTDDGPGRTYVGFTSATPATLVEFSPLGPVAEIFSYDNLTYNGTGTLRADGVPHVPPVPPPDEDPVMPEPDSPSWSLHGGSGAIFDPELADGYIYRMTSESSLFTSILGFPNGFEGTFTVSTSGTVLGKFQAGQVVDFVIGGGVREFTVSGIAPAVDADDPTAFPLRLAFSTPTASFTMTAIPHDSEPPAVSCDSAPTAWLAANVAIACRAEDVGSGLAQAGDGAFVLTTNVADGEETTTASTNTREVCDNVGNCATAGPMTGIWIDRARPKITVRAPQAGNYALGENVPADYDCSDGGSGVVSCQGTVAPGTGVPTDTAAMRTFTVTATDAAGNTATTAVNYQVIAPALKFSFAGLFAPVANPPTVNVAKAGGAVPLRFSLGGNFGLNVFAPGFPVVVQRSCETGGLSDSSIETVTAGSSGLHYDSASDTYQYVWKTDKTMAGLCFQLHLRFVDGTDKAALFKMTK